MLCTCIHAKTRQNHDFFLYDGRQHYSALKKLVVYLQGWSNELVRMLDPVQRRVALVRQIEQLPNLANDFIVIQVL
jgi:hypothetical protein